MRGLGFRGVAASHHDCFCAFLDGTSQEAIVFVTFGLVFWPVADVWSQQQGRTQQFGTHSCNHCGLSFHQITVGTAIFAMPPLLCDALSSWQARTSLYHPEACANATSPVPP